MVVDRPCRAIEIADEHGGRRARCVERASFGADFDRAAYTDEVVDVLAGPRHRPGGDGRLRHRLRQADLRRLRRPHPQHPPGAAARPSRAGTPCEEALAYGVKVTGLHRPRRHPRGRQRPDPRPGGRAGAARRHRVDTLHERIKAVERRALRRHHPRDHRERDRAAVRALLSVYDKTGIVDLARALHELGWRPGVERRHGQGDRRGRHPGHRRRRPHRRAGDPRPPGGHPAPQGPRRHPGRPVRPRAPRRHGGVRHRGHRPRGRRTSTRSRRDPSHRADRHRRARP